MTKKIPTIISLDIRLNSGITGECLPSQVGVPHLCSGFIRLIGYLNSVVGQKLMPNSAAIVPDLRAFIVKIAAHRRPQCLDDSFITIICNAIASICL